MRKLSLLGRLFGDKGEPPPRGLYVHGEVGRGKTMLMDLFFQHSPVQHKRRAHFHEFMAEAHEKIYAYRQNIARGEIADGDVIELTANAIFDEAWLLCFDEFHVTDIADAMILGRLFSKLFELGTVVVATSNVAPEDLYKGGLNRALFLPFIAQIADRMDVLRLDARTDFRLEKLAGVKMWLVPPDDEAGAALDRAWRRMTGNAPCKPRDIAIKGRILRVPCSAHGVARFSFADICEKPLAASDYLRLAHDYHTILIDRIPVMDYPERNAAKRFISLIDTLYDNAVKLMASAEADPVSLYLATEGSRGQRVQADLVAADRNELGILPGPAARPEGFRGERVEYGVGGDVDLSAVIPGARVARTRPRCDWIARCARGMTVALAYLTEIEAGP